jgi:hypothetical protein
VTLSIVLKRYSTIFNTHLSTDAVSLYNDLNQSVALIYSNKHSGISEEEKALPMATLHFVKKIAKRVGPPEEGKIFFK